MTAVELLGKDCRDLLSPSEAKVVTNTYPTAGTPATVDSDTVVVGSDRGDEKGGGGGAAGDYDRDSGEKEGHRKVSEYTPTIY